MDFQSKQDQKVMAFLMQPFMPNLKVVKIALSRALDKREHLMIIRVNFYLFCIKTYVVTPHLNHLDKIVQMRGHNI